MSNRDNKMDLIHQLYQEIVGDTEEEKDSRYIRSTGTLYGNPERFEREAEEKKKQSVKSNDPWSLLDLHPSDIR